jgi:hypothetical protein
MKLNQLFEGPYDMGSEYRPSIKMDAYPSRAGLEREMEFLGDLDRQGKVYSFWLSHKKQILKVTTPGKDDIGQDRELVVTAITFDNRAHLDLPKELQVDTVYTHEKYRGLWLGGISYILLAHYGYTIVSDFTQYRGGIELWKKLARESEARDYMVRVWDDENQQFITDEHGIIINYNAANLDDDVIWQSIADHSKGTTLLVLSK